MIKCSGFDYLKLFLLRALLLKDTWAHYPILDWQLIFLSLLQMFSHWLTSFVLAGLLNSPFYIGGLSFLSGCFKNLSFLISFFFFWMCWNFTTICLDINFFLFILLGVYCASYICKYISISLGNFSTITYLNIASSLIFSSLSIKTLIRRMLDFLSCLLCLFTLNFF